MAGEREGGRGEREKPSALSDLGAIRVGGRKEERSSKIAAQRRGKMARKRGGRGETLISLRRRSLESGLSCTLASVAKVIGC